MTSVGGWLATGGRHLYLTIADLRSEYGLGPAELNSRDGGLPLAWLADYIGALPPTSRLAQAVAAEPPPPTVAVRDVAAARARLARNMGRRGRLVIA